MGWIRCKTSKFAFALSAIRRPDLPFHGALLAGASCSKPNPIFDREGLHMRRCRHTDQEVAFLLREAENGTPISAICETAHISVGTFYRWRRRLGGLPPAGVAHLGQIERENAALRAETGSPEAFLARPDPTLSRSPGWISRPKPSTALRHPQPMAKACAIAEKPPRSVATPSCAAPTEARFRYGRGSSRIGPCRRIGGWRDAWTCAPNAALDGDPSLAWRNAALTADTVARGHSLG